MHLEEELGLRNIQLIDIEKKQEQLYAEQATVIQRRNNIRAALAKERGIFKVLVWNLAEHTNMVTTFEANTHLNDSKCDAIAKLFDVSSCGHFYGNYQIWSEGDASAELMFDDGEIRLRCTYLSNDQLRNLIKEWELNVNVASVENKAKRLKKQYADFTETLTFIRSL